MRKPGIWIESHTDLGRHPKTIRLSKSLETDLPTAIGHLHLLWWWASEYADNGNLIQYSDAELADAAQWKGDGTFFVTALIESGFLDKERTIHEWELYFGKLLAEREGNRRRQRQWRERHQQSKSPDASAANCDVTVRSQLRNPPTVPYRTYNNSNSSSVMSPLRNGYGDNPEPTEILESSQNIGEIRGNSANLRESRVEESKGIVDPKVISNTEVVDPTPPRKVKTEPKITTAATLAEKWKPDGEISKPLAIYNDAFEFANPRQQRVIAGIIADFGEEIACAAISWGADLGQPNVQAIRTCAENMAQNGIGNKKPTRLPAKEKPYIPVMLGRNPSPGVI